MPFFKKLQGIVLKFVNIIQYRNKLIEKRKDFIDMKKFGFKFFGLIYSI